MLLLFAVTMGLAKIKQSKRPPHGRTVLARGAVFRPLQRAGVRGEPVGLSVVEREAT